MTATGRWTRATGRFTGPNGGRPNAVAHLARHGVEWSPPFPSLDAYVASAARLLGREDVPAFFVVQGRSVAKYDLETNELAIATFDDGHIRTHFRPNERSAYAERRLDAGEWIPLELAGAVCIPISARSDDSTAMAMQRWFDRAVEIIATLEPDAIADAIELDETDDAEGSKVLVEMVGRVTMLRLSAWRAEYMAASDDQRAVARQARGVAAEWTAVVESIGEVLGEKLPRAIAMAIGISITWLDTAGDELAGEDGDLVGPEIWDRRDEVEARLAYLAAASIDDRSVRADLRGLRKRLANVDGVLQKAALGRLPSPRDWEPFDGAWWRPTLAERSFPRAAIADTAPGFDTASALDAEADYEPPSPVRLAPRWSPARTAPMPPPAPPPEEEEELEEVRALTDTELFLELLARAPDEVVAAASNHRNRKRRARWDAALYPRRVQRRPVDEFARTSPGCSVAGGARSTRVARRVRRHEPDFTDLASSEVAWIEVAADLMRVDRREARIPKGSDQAPGLAVGAVVVACVLSVGRGGIEVAGPGLGLAFVPREGLSNTRDARPDEQYQIGDQVSVVIRQRDANGRVTLASSATTFDRHLLAIGSRHLGVVVGSKYDTRRGNGIVRTRIQTASGVGVVIAERPGWCSVEQVDEALSPSDVVEVEVVRTATDWRWPHGQTVAFRVVRRLGAGGPREASVDEPKRRALRSLEQVAAMFNLDASWYSWLRVVGHLPTRAFRPDHAPLTMNELLNTMDGAGVVADLAALAIEVRASAVAVGALHILNRIDVFQKVEYANRGERMPKEALRELIRSIAEVAAESRRSLDVELSRIERAREVIERSSAEVVTESRRSLQVELSHVERAREVIERASRDSESSQRLLAKGVARVEVALGGAAALEERFSRCESLLKNADVVLARLRQAQKESEELGAVLAQLKGKHDAAISAAMDASAAARRATEDIVRGHVATEALRQGRGEVLFKDVEGALARLRQAQGESDELAKTLQRLKDEFAAGLFASLKILRVMMASATRGGERGVEIAAYILAHGLNGLKATCIVYFYYASDNVPVLSHDSKFSAVGNGVTPSTDVTFRPESALGEEVSFFVPLRAFNLRRRDEGLYWLMVIWSVPSAGASASRELARSEKWPFTL